MGNIPSFVAPPSLTGGGLLYKKDGDARWEILIERLKGTNLGVA